MLESESDRGAYLIGSTALIRRRLSVRLRGVGDALQTDTGQTASGKLSVREARAAEVGCMGDREQSVRQTAFAGS